MKTKGNIIIENIKIGDIHYEYAYGRGIKCQVISLPIMEKTNNGEITWSWQSKKFNSEEIINYFVNGNHLHYGPNLYDYEAYLGIAID